MALTAAAGCIAACHAPAGPEALSAVPTVLRAGHAFNVVPPDGELLCDLRADRVGAFEAVVAAVPGEVYGATLEAGLLRRLPEMDTGEATGGLLKRAGERLERPIVGVERSGSSDANHLAGAIPWTVDGLGPQGGTSHVPEEWVLAESLRARRWPLRSSPPCSTTRAGQTRADRCGPAKRKIPLPRRSSSAVRAAPLYGAGQGFESSLRLRGRPAADTSAGRRSGRRHLCRSHLPTAVFRVRLRRSSAAAPRPYDAGVGRDQRRGCRTAAVGS